MKFKSLNIQLSLYMMVVLLVLMVSTAISKPPISVGQIWIRCITHKGSNFIDTVKIVDIKKNHIEYLIISSNRKGKTFETFFLKNFKYIK